MPNRTIAPELLDYTQWVGVDARLLSEADAIRFTRLVEAVKAACDGVKSGEIKRRYGITRDLLCYYLHRCAEEDQDGQLKGWRALVHASHHDSYIRNAPLCPDEHGNGLSGAFDQLLQEYSKVHDWLDARLRPNDGAKFPVAGLRLADIHQEFLTKLRKAGCHPNQYPFTTKRHGYEALCHYVRKRIADGDSPAARLKYGEHAVDGVGRNSGKIGLFRPIVAYERVAYDEYQLPEIDTISIVTDDEEVTVPLRRSYFCPIVDFKTSCILGYSYSVAGSFRTLDLLQAFESAIHPPQRIKHPAFEDLEPLPDEGLPASVVPGATGRRICSLAVDNHLTHLANSVVKDLRQRTGVSISFGKVHSWIERSVVEGLFAEFQNRLSRLPSTTGSGSSDPSVSDPVGKAVHYKIEASAIRALLDQLVARHNAKRKRALMMVTPNEAIAADWSSDSRLQIVPTYSKSFVDNPCIAIEQEWATIRGNRKNGRTPYVQLDEVDYTNDFLKQSWGLIGQKLCIHIRGDYRTVRAFREDGTEFGVLHVSGVWAISAHTREMRKEVNRLYREDVFNDRSLDPIALYRKYLAGIALQKTKGKRHPKITREASKLARSMSVPGSPDDSSDFRYTGAAPQSPEPATVKPRGRRAFFVSTSDP